jgi:hypothetical protein
MFCSCRAAKQRAAQQAIMSQGPQRLGGSLGSASLRRLSPQEAAARAAERRKKDDAQCPTAAIAAGETIVIDLLGEDSDEEGGAQGLSGETWAILNRAIPWHQKQRLSLGAGAAVSNPKVPEPAPKRLAAAFVAGSIAQLGKYAGQAVPGFDACSSEGQQSSGEGRGGSRAMHAQSSDPRAAKRSGCNLYESGSSMAGASSLAASKVSKYAEAQNVKSTLDVIDLINSPSEACCSRQRTVPVRESGGRHKTFDLVDGGLDLADKCVPCKRPKGRAQPQVKSDTENNEDRPKDERCIDLT